MDTPAVWVVIVGVSSDAPSLLSGLSTVAARSARPGWNGSMRAKRRRAGRMRSEAAVSHLRWARQSSTRPQPAGDAPVVPSLQ
jgi:hypothetical protein